MYFVYILKGFSASKEKVNVKKDIAYTYNQDVKPSGKRIIHLERKEEVDSRKKMIPPFPKKSIADGGKRIIAAPVRNDAHPQGKKLIYNEEGILVSDAKSVVGDATGFSGGVKKYGGKKSGTFSHGTVWPSNKDYPPSFDKEGNPIDYSVAKNGGIFKETFLRGRIVTVPVVLEKERPALKLGAVQRYREWHNKSSLQEMWSAGGSGRKAVKSNIELNSKDREIIKLREELKSLSAS